MYSVSYHGLLAATQLLDARLPRTRPGVAHVCNLKMYAFLLQESRCEQSAYPPAFKCERVWGLHTKSAVSSITTRACFEGTSLWNIALKSRAILPTGKRVIVYLQMCMQNTLQITPSHTLGMCGD
jgi:hypothetical protein